MSDQIAVLYVEDDRSSRKVMDLILRARMGLQNVTIFENSENFLERVLALNPMPDVIFLDIHMAPHDGFEMLTMLKGNEKLKDIPVIALTASVMNEEVERLRTAGFQGCLAKPIDSDAFPQTLARIRAGELVWEITG